MSFLRPTMTVARGVSVSNTHLRPAYSARMFSSWWVTHRRFLLIRCWLLLSACACLFGCSAPTWQQVSAGKYEPDPTKSWYAGEIILICGSSYEWSYFTEAIESQPASQHGSVRSFDGYIVLEGLMWNPKRIVGTLSGVSVLWTEKAYIEWKRTGTVDLGEILFRAEK
jgi:hypothetical protein